MACRKCRAGAAKVAPALDDTPTYEFKMFFEPYAPDQTSIAARQCLKIQFLNEDIYMAAGKVIQMPTNVVNELIKIGAPVWTF